MTVNEIDGALVIALGCVSVMYAWVITHPKPYSITEWRKRMKQLNIGTK